jgi:hypothetical protein
MSSNNKKTEYSVQYLENLSADLTTNPPFLRRLIVGKTASGGIADTVAEYGLNNIAEDGDITYLGKESAEDEWLVVKIDATSDTEFTYATVKNNPTVTTYADCWTNRATLTYNKYGIAF